VAAELWVASLQLSAPLWVFLIASADDEFPPLIQDGDQDKLHLLCELQTSGEIEVFSFYISPELRHLSSLELKALSSVLVSKCRCLAVSCRKTKDIASV